MTKIYLVRHAEAEGNLFLRCQGHIDTRVTPRGEKQIAALKARFADLPLDACYSSDLKRARQTAAALCEDFLTAAGVTDAALHTAYLAETQGCYGYVFCYTRTVFGHPAALTSRNVRHSDNRWDYETLRFVVDSDGLQTVHWQSPTTLGNLVEANPAILSFSDAYAIFPPAITAAYAEKTERYGEDHLIALDVRRIDLAHVRIRDMGADGKAGYYVPAWVFYGTERDDGHYTMNGYTLVSDETVPKIRSEILLAINALDGSIIDFTKGY